MAGKVEKRREALRKTLADIAERLIAEKGIGAIKARDLAREAECAVGAIYNVFNDLDEIVIAVNGRTFQQLGEEVSGSLVGHEDDDPTERLILMSKAYLNFASTHPRKWRTLFDVNMSTEMQVPDWYLNELGRLFSYISAPLRMIFPQMAAQEIDLMTRTLFSSIHGIVLLGLENRISGVPRDRVEAMIELILRRMTSLNS